ncbi:hypothetical protein WJX79_004097 [Trebouxia sp. C0005]
MVCWRLLTLRRVLDSQARSDTGGSRSLHGRLPEADDMRLGQMGQDTNREKPYGNLDQYPLSLQAQAAGCAEPAVTQLEAATVAARQELENKQHDLIHMVMQRLP